MIVHLRGLMRARRRRYPGLRLRDIRDSSHHVLMQSDDIRQKGLNLAVSDVFYLSRALAETYKTAKT